MKSRHTRYVLEIVLGIALVILINGIAKNLNFFVDLTEDKRFTLADSTREMLGNVDDIVYIEVLLEGDLDAGFRQLQNRTEEIIKQFRNVNPNIEFSFIDPSAGTAEEINTLRQNLSKDGIFPTNLMVTENGSRVEKLIYPYAVIQYGNRKLPVNLLESISGRESKDQALNRSEQLIEYKIANAIAKLFKKSEPIVVFTSGNGELAEIQTAKLEDELGFTMTTGRINLDSIYQLSQEIDVLIVAHPTEKMSQRSKFLIDQYIMNGGNVIWLIDQFFVNLDSINRNGVYIPEPIEHGLDDLFFKYGIRVNRNIVLDMENTKIPQVIGMQGNKAQTELFNWVYHPLLQPASEHPIVKNIDRVSTTFPASIDMLEDTPLPLEHTPLLSSSQYSRFQYSPVRLSFDILRVEQKPSAYNKSFLPVAVLVEGQFESAFKNRVSENMESMLQQINVPFTENSPRTSQIFVADGDFVKNLFDAQSNRISPIGWNKWERVAYEGNRDFIINSIDYMLDEYGLIEARTKNVKLRLLDQVKLESERLKYQIINIIAPILLLIIFGLLFNYMRKRRYT